MPSVKTLPRPIVIGLALIVILTVAYIYVYQAAPFPEPWTSAFLNLQIILPALLSAVLATLVWRSFLPQDGPRGVWLYFALGLWSWAVAEIAWFGVWWVFGEVPTPSLADVFYLLALPLFAVSFILQYRLIYSTSKAQEWRWLLAFLVGVLALSFLGTWLLLGSTQGAELSWWEAFLEVFYVADDLAMMVAALGLARLFGRGVWGRAWWGMLAFVLSDGLYSYIATTGLYAQALDSGNILTLICDCLYAVAYMLMALACWSQLLLVRHGPSLTPQAVDVSQLPQEGPATPGSLKA